MDYTLGVSSPAFAVTKDPLDLKLLVHVVTAHLPATTGAGIGAINSFLGIVRGENMGRRVLRLEYEAYEPLTLRSFRQLEQEVSVRWPLVRLAIHHRLGRLEVGEISVAIAAAASHRAETFSVCRYAIERVKQIAPIWKHEFFAGGDVWIEGATADPDDEAARQRAYKLACT